MTGKRKNKILILCPSPFGTAATQRLKYEQYLGELEKENYAFTISSFQTQRFWKIIYKPGRVLEKIFWTVIGYAIRTGDLLRAPFYDAVFVNLWVTPIGLPWFERLLFFFNRNVIYDIDDMIFLSKDVEGKKRFVHRLKGKNKPLVLMKRSKYVIVCTPKLEEIAKELNRYGRAVDISSTFDTERFLPVKEYAKREVTIIGWTGTHSTIPFLETLTPVLQRVAALRPVQLLVIANKEYHMPGVKTNFVFWDKDREIDDLHKMDIGLYPIPANEWSLGKSSLKALTYMAIAIPFVATAYGTNFRIMTNGVEGFLAQSEEEWADYLVKLVDDVALRRQMGTAGRQRVVNDFSVKANLPKYLHVLNSVIQK